MKRYSKIVDLFLRAHNKFNLLESEPRDFSTGDLLYSTEIHTIVAIGEKPAINLTQLAENLGVSKSAVSKFIKKLLKKGYVLKSRPVGNHKEVIFNLTDRGKTAFKGHEEFSREIFGSLYDILENIADREIITIENFLKKLNEELDDIK
ncbi:MarR family transcriptional regulator [Iocasia frigidifontis]|uniref:MarR family transcriptional regulator n=1 Tax=Iocasia fonsfrigidae TaxID=2682810 RepID=A0A8A7KH43_9FIRM|nr:MarR family transcriptional regulator [Iocasia fonsfrigidae]QTL98839.1 MarR family transcriptional regulator [Iocasia fonsfrigidae]